MIDTWSAEKALEKFVNTIPDDAWTDELHELSKRTYDQVISVGEDHDCSYECDECSRIVPGVDGSVALSEVEDLLRRIRMGYEVEPLETVLENLRREFNRD